MAFPQSLSNLHDVFHVSQLQKYVHDPSHVIQMDGVYVRNNLIVEAPPMQIKDREGGAWRTFWREHHVGDGESDKGVLLKLFFSGIFEDENPFKWEKVVTHQL